MSAILLSTLFFLASFNAVLAGLGPNMLGAERAGIKSADLNFTKFQSVDFDGSDRTDTPAASTDRCGYVTNVISQILCAVTRGATPVANVLVGFVEGMVNTGIFIANAISFFVGLYAFVIPKLHPVVAAVILVPQLGIVGWAVGNLARGSGTSS